MTLATLREPVLCAVCRNYVHTLTHVCSLLLSFSLLLSPSLRLSVSPQSYDALESLLFFGVARTAYDATAPGVTGVTGGGAGRAGGAGEAGGLGVVGRMPARLALKGAKKVATRVLETDDVNGTTTRVLETDDVNGTTTSVAAVAAAAAAAADAGESGSAAGGGGWKDGWIGFKRMGEILWMFQMGMEQVKKGYPRVISVEQVRRVGDGAMRYISGLSEVQVRRS